MPLRPPGQLVDRRTRASYSHHVGNERFRKYCNKLPLARAEFKAIRLPALIGCLGLLFAGGYLLAYIATGFTRYGHQTRVNVILCVSDGFGPASETFARAYVRYLKQTGSPLTAEGTGRWSFPSPSSPPKGAAAAAAAASAAASQADFVKLPLWVCSPREVVRSDSGMQR